MSEMMKRGGEGWERNQFVRGWWRLEREHDGANGEGHVFGVFDAGRERRVRGEGED